MDPVHNGAEAQAMVAEPVGMSLKAQDRSCSHPHSLPWLSRMLLRASGAD